jgi:pyrroline-5-carboxylate reductase
MSRLNATIGFIGCGQMARALARGFVSAGLAGPHQVWGADPAAAARDELARLLPEAHLSADNVAVARTAGILFLAVKPQQMAQVLTELRPAVGGEQLVVSIAAGVRLRTLDAALPAARLVRVMPNTPCLVGQSASAFCMGPRTTEADEALIARLLGAVGEAWRLDEALLDAVTGLSGSGPAYACLVIEALADGGVRMGLPRQVAVALAAQTLKGTASMLLASGEHPAVLKDRVASPGGTTIAGLEALEAGGLRSALIAAVVAATRRSQELAGPATDQPG